MAIGLVLYHFLIPVYIWYLTLEVVQQCDCILQLYHWSCTLHIEKIRNLTCQCQISSPFIITKNHVELYFLPFSYLINHCVVPFQVHLFVFK